MLSVMYNGEYLTDVTEKDIFNPDFKEDLFAAQNSFYINIESDKTLEEFKTDLLNNNFANEWSNGNYRVLDVARSYCSKFAGRVAVRRGDQNHPYFNVWDEVDVSRQGWGISIRAIANAIHYYLFRIESDLLTASVYSNEIKEDVDVTKFKTADYYRSLFDKISDPNNALYGRINDNKLNFYKKSRPDLHIAEDGTYKISLTAKGKELYRAGIVLGIVDFVHSCKIYTNEWTTIYDEHKEVFDKMLKDAGITEDNKDSIRNKAINFKAYRIKDYKGVEKNIKRFKNDILSEVCNVGRLAKKMMTEDGVKHYGKQEIDRLDELSKVEKDFYNENRGPKSKLQLTVSDLRKLSKMNKIERDLLLNSGFSGDDLMMIVRYNLPETDGIPRFTVDYNNYLHSLRGFNRGCNSDYYPGGWEVEAYKYPLVRELSLKEDDNEYLAADVHYLDPSILEQMLEDGIKIEQIKVIADEWHKALADEWYKALLYGNEKITDEEKKALRNCQKTLTNNIVGKIRHNMYLYATDQKDKMEDISTALLKELQTNKTIEPYKSTKTNEVEKMFNEKYHFVPKCVPQIKHMVTCGYMTATDAVNNFDRKKIQEFAALSNPAMIRLTYELNTNALTDRQKQVLECYATPQNIDALIELKDLWKDNSKNWRTDDFAGFVEAANYINQDEKVKSLISDASTKFGLVREEIKKAIEYQRAELDIRNYEEDYEYSFKDNSNEDIKGREISVKSANNRDLTARILAPDDPLLFTKGYKTYSCDHYDGAGENCVYAQTSGDFPNAGGFVIEEKGRLVAQAYVWTDNKHDTFVFDNIEFANDRDTKQYTDILQEYAKALPYKNVHMGRGYNENMAKSIESRASDKINCNLKKNEKVYSPSYMEDGKQEYIYTDYSSSAVVLKRDGEMTFSAEHPERYEVQNNIATESPDRAEEQTDISAIDYLHESPDDTIARIMKQHDEKTGDCGLYGRDGSINRAFDESART